MAGNPLAWQFFSGAMTLRPIPMMVCPASVVATPNAHY